MLYIHEELPAVPCRVLNDVGFDNSLWYTISLTNNDKLLVGVLYRAPLHPLTMIKNCFQSLVTFTKHIMGDFNFPSINWVDLVCSSGKGKHSLASLFLDAVQDSYLVQHVTNCTRHRQGQQSSLLDLVFSSDPNFK